MENCDGELQTLLGHSGIERTAFPTRQLFSAIRSFFLDLTAIDAEDFTVPKDAWNLALTEAMVVKAAELGKFRPPSKRKKGK